MESEQNSNMAAGSRSFSQALSIHSAKSQQSKNVTTLRMHPLQKDNPGVKGLGIKHDFDGNLHIDMVVNGLEIGVLYLDASFHDKNQGQLEHRIDYLKKGSEAQSGKKQYVAYIMDHKDAQSHVASISLLCMENDLQMLPLSSKEDFKTFMVGLSRQAYSLLNRTQF